MVTRIVAPQIAREATRKLVASAAPVARRAGNATRVMRKKAACAGGGVLRLSGERMTKVDTAWLRMDSPSNLMMIMGVWTLEPGINGMSYVKSCPAGPRGWSRRRCSSEGIPKAAGLDALKPQQTLACEI